MQPRDDDSDDERGLLEEGTPGPRARRWELAKPWRAWMPPMICLLLGFALGVGFESLNVTNTWSEQRISATMFDADVSVNFAPNAAFTSLNLTDEVTSDAWANLIPVGRGFIRLDQEENLILHDGQSSSATQTKVVSVFHQIHCLNMLRKSIAASYTNYQEFHYLIPQLSQHWSHCFDYLRQSLMCSADLTLEALETDGGKTLAAVNGWGTTHQCKDFGKVKAWAAAHRDTDDEGID